VEAYCILYRRGIHKRTADPLLSTQGVRVGVCHRHVRARAAVPVAGGVGHVTRGGIGEAWSEARVGRGLWDLHVERLWPNPVKEGKRTQRVSPV